MFCRVETLPDSIIKSLREETLANQLSDGLSQVNLSRQLQVELTKAFMSKGMPALEYAMAFKWKAGHVQPIHVDGNPPTTVRKSSVNLLVKGGEGNLFQWFDASIDASNTHIAAYACDETTAKLIYEEPLEELSVVRTDIPHRVHVVSDTILLCLRLRGNPQLL